MLPSVTVSRHAFVAHQRTEATIVHTLRMALLATGWRLNDVIPDAERWEELAADAIEESDAFVLIATRQSLASKPCRFEWELASALGKPIIRLDVASSWEQLVPQELAGQRSVIVSEPFEDRVTEIARALTEACDRTLEGDRSGEGRREG